ncbi:MAG: hypothetical protein ACI883_000686 [Candidatus Azotimanducaceae bacterium]|jgi:hypothetical protein|tara:strand:+ start:565 stop:1566 length:1002 start_codon:yes stop_codon:yes gene_type:complete
MLTIIIPLLAGISLTVLVLILLQKRRPRIQAILASENATSALPYTHEWELYHNALAPSQRICVGLAELNIPYKSYYITMESDSRDAIPTHIMKELPNHQLPMLLHNGRALYNSRKQMKYLIAQQAANGQMIPAAADEKSRLEEWLSKTSDLDDDEFQLKPGNEIFTIALPLWAAALEQVSYRRMVKTFLFNRFARKPIRATAIRTLKLLSVLENPKLNDAFETAKETIEAQLDEIEYSLVKHKGPCITGETFTQIDVETMVLLDRLNLMTMLEDLMNSHRPNLRLYWENLQPRPSYKKAILSYRRPDIKAARLKILATRETNKGFDEMLRVNH